MFFTITGADFDAPKSAAAVRSTTCTNFFLLWLTFFIGNDDAIIRTVRCRHEGGKAINLAADLFSIIVTVIVFFHLASFNHIRIAAAVAREPKIVAIGRIAVAKVHEILAAVEPRLTAST